MSFDYQYPPSTPGKDSKEGNYYHNLNGPNEKALNIVRTWIVDNQIEIADLCTGCLNPTLILLRYLRANQFNTVKTIDHITKNIAWRKENRITELIKLTPEAILGCKIEELTAVFPHWHSGYDKTGRPVLYKHYGKFEATVLKKKMNGSFDNIVNYHIWEQEACSRLCLAQSHKLGQIVETCSCIIDVKDMTLSQVTGDFLNLVKQLAAVDQNQYPETLGRIFILNTPSAFPFVWRMVKVWLDPAVAAKITVCSNASAYEPVLFEFIGKENLPKNYGGNLPFLNVDVHPYAETMLEYVNMKVSAAVEEREEEKEEEKAVDSKPSVVSSIISHMVTTDFKYPEKTPGSDNKDGYFHRLSGASEKALAATRTWMIDNQIDMADLCTDCLHPSLILLRYLRANGFNAEKSIEHMERNIAWRKEHKVREIVAKTPEAILGCKIEELTAVFPHWHSGYDKTGRPVLYKHYGKFEATVLKKKMNGSFDNIVNYHIWEQEACSRLCLAQSHKLGQIVETCSCIIDVKDMTLSQVTGDFLNLVKQLAAVDQNQYPETLGRIFILNTPSAFPFVWRMVKVWLDPAVAAKITVCSNASAYEPVLFEFIGKENLPKNYGGNLPFLNVDVHPYAETMLEYEAVSSNSNAAQSEVEVVTKPIITVSTVVTTDFKYPEKTPGSDSKDGYFHKLGGASEKALAATRTWMIDNQIDMADLCTDCLHPSLILLRYLRANGFNAEKSIEHMERNIAWRKEHKVREIIAKTPEAILGCKIEELTAVFPHWHSGYDKTGRPVLYKHYGKFEATVLKKKMNGSFDNIVNYHIWEQEACSRLCLAQSHKLGQIVETCSCIIDVKDMTLSQVTGDFLNLVKQLAAVDQNQYPETLGRIFILNTPSAFPFVWRMVKVWLDPAVAAKITVCSNASAYEPVLFEFIGKENLPKNYGGNLPFLNVDVHPYAETMLEYEAATQGAEKEKFVSLSEVNLGFAPVHNKRNSYRSQHSHNGDNRPVSYNSKRNSSASYHSVGSVSHAPPSTGFAYYATMFLKRLHLFPDDESDASGYDEEANIAGVNPQRAAVETKSQASSDDDDLFADAFETQSEMDNSTVQSPHVRFAVEEFNASALEAGHHGEQSSSKSIASKIANSCLFNVFRMFLRCITPKLEFMSFHSLIKCMQVSVSLYFLCASAAMVLSALLLSVSRFDSGVSRAQLWTGILIMLVSTLMLIFNFVGYLAIRTKSRPLLIMFASGLFIGSLVFSVVSIACFLYYYVPEVAGFGNKALNSTLDVDKNEEQIRQYDILLAVGCLIAAVFGIIPLILSLTLIRRLKREFGRISRIKRIKNLQILLRIAQIISICFAVVMIGYGGSCLYALVEIHFPDAVFDVYGLIYGGVSVIISSTVGLWSSTTVHKSVLRFYYRVILPVLIFVLFIIACISFIKLQSSDRVVARAYDTLDAGMSEDSVKVLVQTNLLVVGILCSFAWLFQSISFAAAWSLSKLIDTREKEHDEKAILKTMREKELGILPPGESSGSNAVDPFLSQFSIHHLGRMYMIHVRGNRDKLVIMYAIAMGITNIFVLGTYTIFSAVVNNNGMEDMWEVTLWRAFGAVDTRFVNGDGFLVATCAILAIIVGPLLLLYAWATFVLAPFRHVTGIVTSVVQITAWVQFFSIEINALFIDLYGDSRPAGLVFYVLISFLLFVVGPAVILYREVRATIHHTSKSDSHELLLESNKEDNFLHQSSEPAADGSSPGSNSQFKGTYASTGRHRRRTHSTGSSSITSLNTSHDMFSRFSIDETAQISGDMRGSSYRYGGREAGYVDTDRGSESAGPSPRHNNRSPSIATHSTGGTGGTVTRHSSITSGSNLNNRHHRSSSGGGALPASEECEEKSDHFEPLTNYSIAAIAAANNRQANSLGATGIDAHSHDDGDLLYQNTTNNKFLSAGTAASSALGAMIRQSSFPYNRMHQHNNGVLTQGNMNHLLSQIGVNTAEAATVMINLIRVKENKSKQSLAMVI